jgi:hypothetical protein
VQILTGEGACCYFREMGRLGEQGLFWGGSLMGLHGYLPVTSVLLLNLEATREKKTAAFIMCGAYIVVQFRS